MMFILPNSSIDTLNLNKLFYIFITLNFIILITNVIIVILPNMNTTLQIFSVLLAVSLFAGLATIAISPIVTLNTANAESPFKDSPSDDDNGGGNDPPNNKNHRGNK